MDDKKGKQLVELSQNKKKAKDDQDITQFSSNNYWKLAPQYDIDDLMHDQ